LEPGFSGSELVQTKSERNEKASLPNFFMKFIPSSFGWPFLEHECTDVRSPTRFRPADSEIGVSGRQSCVSVSLSADHPKSVRPRRAPVAYCTE
jgi:hypothetical protein